MNGKFDRALGDRKEKVESLTKLREERAKSRSEERRATSAVRLLHKEAHVKRVVSRGGSHAEVTKSQAEVKLK